MVWMGVAKAAQLVALAHLDLGFSEFFYFVNNIWRLYLNSSVTFHEKKNKVLWLIVVAKLSDDVVLVFHAGISYIDICLPAKSLITLVISFHYILTYLVDYLILGGTSTWITLKMESCRLPSWLGYLLLPQYLHPWQRC